MRSDKLGWTWLAVAVGLGLFGACQVEESGQPIKLRQEPSHGAPIPPANEAAFVTRASIAVLGRPPLSLEERAELVDALGGGPGALIDQLTTGAFQDEYVRHWTSVLLDMFRVYRLTEGSRTSPGCWNQISVADPTAQAELARHIATNTTDAAWPGGAFTMRDVVEGSLRADDLRAPLRANLFAQLATPLTGNEVTEPNRRADLWTRFEAAYLNRQLLCLSCHNNEFSVSGNVSDWDRHAPLPDLLEDAVFGLSSARRSRPPNLHADFRYEGVIGGDVQPWGMTNCGSFDPTPSPQFIGVGGFECPARAPETFAMGDVGYAESRSDVCFSPNPGDPRVPPLAEFALTAPDIVGSVFRIDEMLHRGMASMAATGLAGLEGLTPDPVSGELTREVEPNATDMVAAGERAFAIMVAANLAERVWEEVYGSRLTLAHYVPRLAENRDTLLQLTQIMLQNPLGDPWSLRAILRAVMERPEFNAAAGRGDPDEDEYPLPRVFDPWVPADPRPAPDPAGLCSATTPTYEGCVRGLLRLHRCVNCHSNPEPSIQRFMIDDISSVWARTAEASVCQGLVDNVACASAVDCAAVAGRPASMLAVLVSCTQPGLRMPLGLAPLPQADIDAIVRWVSADAPEGVRGPPPPLPAGTTQNQVEHNGVGDRVSWKSPFQLTYTMGSALGLEPWSTGPFPQAQYPDRIVAESAGHHLLESIPGGRGFSILSLLSWERAHAATEPCRVGTGTDRIDALVEAAADEGATVESAVRELKQSMFGEGELGVGDSPGAGDGERALIDAVLEGPQLSDTVTAGNSAEVNAGLRRVCNVFLKSPLFALSYLEPKSTGADPTLPPADRPPWPDLCNERLDCRPLLDALSEILNECWFARPSTCLAAIGDAITNALRDLRLPVEASEQTLSRALKRAPHLVPSENDPRLESNLLVLPLADGKVKRVLGQAYVLRSGKWHSLKRGSALEFGDALFVSEGTHLELAANGVRFETGRGGMEKVPEPKDDDRKHHGQKREASRARGAWIVLVNGADAVSGPPLATDPNIERGEPLPELPSVPRDGVQPAWATYGEAGLWYASPPL